MWTKSQKVSAGVLGLAVAAFLVDRLVLGGGSGPDDATADEFVATPSTSGTPTGPASANAAPATVSNTAQVAIPVISLASRLNALAEARRLRAAFDGDAFRPSAAWVAAVTPPPPAKSPTATAKATAPAAPKIDHALNFQRSHTLTAVMTNTEGGMAIVNGKLYKTGQLIDGFKLTKVGMKDAQFSGKGKHVTLTLPGQPVADAR